VVIQGGSGHTYYMNTEAMKRAGYDIKSEPDGQAAYYHRDERTGQLSGYVADNAMNKAGTSIPNPSLHHVKRAMKEGQYLLHKAGVTSCQEASANSLMLQALRELDAEGTLTLNIQPHIVYAPEWVAQELMPSLHKLLDQAAEFKSRHVDTRFVKIILDGYVNSCIRGSCSHNY
jgi:predicted amidohydrolase YtcJ